MSQSIQDITYKIKTVLVSDTVFPALLIIMVGIASFGLGRASVGESERTERQDLPVAVTITDNRALVGDSTSARVAGSATTSGESVSPSAPTGERYVGSKNGTKFHLESCPGAAQIKEENKIYFTSKQDAYSKGYTEAANCKGI
jgi:hypothetical protein